MTFEFYRYRLRDKRGIKKLGNVRLSRISRDPAPIGEDVVVTMGPLAIGLNYIGEYIPLVSIKSLKHSLT